MLNVDKKMSKESMTNSYEFLILTPKIVRNSDLLAWVFMVGWAFEILNWLKKGFEQRKPFIVSLKAIRGKL